MTYSKIPRLDVIGVTGLPEISAGEKLGDMIADAAQAQGTPIEAGDVLVVTQKIVSKAEDMLVDLNTVEPSEFARRYAEVAGKNPNLVELVLRESKSIVRMDAERGIMISETHHGFVCANAGIDSSNVFGDDIVCLLPKDPDKSAQRILEEIRAMTGQSVAVIISDTFGRAWRDGHVNFAIGVAGMNPVHDYRGTIDASGKLLKVTTIAIADELASASELVTAKSINVPAAIIRGVDYEPEPGGISVLIRDRSRDLFR